MVAWTSHDARWKDRRRTLVNIPTGRSGNSKGVRWSPRLLADVTIRQLRLVRAKKRNNGSISDVMRNGRSWRSWNDPRARERFRSSGPYLTTANAPSRQNVGSRLVISSVSATACGPQSLISAAIRLRDLQLGAVKKRPLLAVLLSHAESAFVLWHNPDLPRCPLFGRYQMQTGHEQAAPDKLDL